MRIGFRYRYRRNTDPRCFVRNVTACVASAWRVRRAIPPPSLRPGGPAQTLTSLLSYPGR